MSGDLRERPYVFMQVRGLLVSRLPHAIEPRVPHAMHAMGTGDPRSSVMSVRVGVARRRHLLADAAPECADEGVRAEAERTAVPSAAVPSTEGAAVGGARLRTVRARRAKADRLGPGTRAAERGGARAGRGAPDGDRGHRTLGSGAPRD